MLGPWISLIVVTVGIVTFGLLLARHADKIKKK
jgi:hypothetical protein